MFNISKREVEEMINTGVDYNYEIFYKICDAIDSTKGELETLPEIYQIIYSINAVEGEIYNGGFFQYYSNSTAEVCNKIAIKSFRTIGAIDMANLLQEVFNKILEQSAIFRAEYEIIGIQDAFNKATNEINDIEISEYDDKFYKIVEKDSYKKLIFDYIKNNINSFS